MQIIEGTTAATTVSAAAAGAVLLASVAGTAGSGTAVGAVRLIHSTVTFVLTNKAWGCYGNLTIVPQGTTGLQY